MIEVPKEMSNAAAERAAAQRALRNGGFAERDTYTAKQIAMRCGTDAKTMRKFFRSSHSTVDPVGQGGRYEFDASDLPKIKEEFRKWTKRAQANSTRKPTPKAPGIHGEGLGTGLPNDGDYSDIELKALKQLAKEQAAQVAPKLADEDFTQEQITDAIMDQFDQENTEPTPKELAELEEIADLDLDLEEDE